VTSQNKKRVLLGKKMKKNKNKNKEKLRTKNKKRKNVCGRDWKEGPAKSFSHHPPRSSIEGKREGEVEITT
jgi:hypothetical protein